MSRKYKITILPVVLIILALFSFYGCSGGTTQTSSIPNTWTGVQIEQLNQTQLQQMLADSITNYKAVKSYKFDMVNNITTNVTGGSSPWEASMDTIIEGAANIETDQTHMILNMSVLFSGMGAKDERNSLIYDIYAIDKWIYMNQSLTGVGSQWIKVAMSDFMREAINLNTVDRQIIPLENPSTITYQRTESFNGIDCYVFSVLPSQDNLGDWLNKQNTSYKTMDWKNVISDANVFKNFSLLCYLSVDTNQLIGVSMDMTVNLSPTTAGLPSLDFTNMLMSIKLSMNLFDFDVPFALELPAEASNAKLVTEDVFKN